MRDDVRRAALDAAYKVTLSVAALSGCTGSEPRPPIAADPSTTSAPSTTAQAPQPTASSVAPASDQECESLVQATFPTPSNYPGDQKDITTQVATCCQQLLRKESGSMMKNRWDCCANLSEKTMVHSACTPWGPPMPPPMPELALA